MKQFVFKPNAKLSICVAVMLPLLLLLGMWQLQRAQYKQTMQMQVDQKFNQPAVELCDYLRASGALSSSFEHWEQLDTQFMRVKFRAKLDRRYFLIDNQNYRSKVGYEVLQLAEACGISIAISRGFVVAPTRRDMAPDINIERGERNIEAYLYQPQLNTWLKDSVESPFGPWPKRISQFRASIIAPFTTKVVLPSIARLSGRSALLFTPHWSLKQFSPQKHLAYAVQWFGLAVMVLLMFIYSSIERK